MAYQSREPDDNQARAEKRGFLQGQGADRPSVQAPSRIRSGPDRLDEQKGKTMNKDLFHLICLVWAVLAVVTFFLLLYVKAPYGRHVNRAWGPQISNKLGWVLMELPSFACILYFTLLYPHSTYALLLLFLWLLALCESNVCLSSKDTNPGKENACCHRSCGRSL